MFNMFKILSVLFVALTIVWSFPTNYLTQNFSVGIRYDGALPMQGGSDRFRHRNNFEPFSITVSTNAKNGYVIVYLEVTVTVDLQGEIDFCLTQGQTGSKSMEFQINSNQSDFLSYSYRTYGIWEENYQKMANHIIIIPSNSSDTYKGSLVLLTFLTIFQLIFFYT